MAPLTRANANAASSQTRPVGSHARGSELDSHFEMGQVEVHMHNALKGARALQKELTALRKRNVQLERRLKSIEEAEDVSVQPKRGKKVGPTVAELQSRIRDLEKARQKNRRKIEKLRAKEVKADAAELEDIAEFEVGDSAYRMRKLLRRFHDLMVSSSIEEDEECPICMEQLKLNKCASLPCEHTFCESCIMQISPGSDYITCPQCRGSCPRDEIEVVQYTASQQWDALLDVANSWAKMDLRRHEDTSEEEAEEDFIDNGHPEARSASTNPLATSPEAEPLPKTEPHLELVAPAVSENIHQAIPTPVTLSRKRRIAFSPESSPLSQDSDDEPLTASGSSKPAHRSGHNSAEREFCGSPSNAVDLPHQEATEETTTHPRLIKPLYAQSPVAEKRKRLENLAVARKRKRL
ncbi:uncharacterized protein FIBRA_04426 [Fibroporia radiculosa]|uniref:RING-type domain-containing protein n=1 Tax=Fibroporia radiculosa TaxID=599839 RepID=J4H2Y5_9APHY|nr:uncharacterized protein FIBRA_04426 [Fibroporia radiculosa]CCM02334.1 predicted protein [Fibroporia radiculosa]